MEEPKVRLILVPVDFSEITGEVLGEAVYLARLLSAELCLFHAVHVPALAEASTWLDPVISPTMEQDIRRQMTTAAAARLQELVEDCRSRGVPASSRLEEGVPYTEIVKAAEEMKANLIILGSQGHSAISRLLLGSVAERVVRRAPCHVLCVKPRPKEQA